MDEFTRLQMSVFGGWLDLITLIAFVLYALVYLLSPFIGHEEPRPQALLTAMYLMVACGGVVLVQLVAQWLPLLDRRPMPRLTQDQVRANIMLACTALKLALFLVGMMAFIRGLRALRIRPPNSDA